MTSEIYHVIDSADSLFYNSIKLILKNKYYIYIQSLNIRVIFSYHAQFIQLFHIYIKIYCRREFIILSFFKFCLRQKKFSQRRLK